MSGLGGEHELRRGRGGDRDRRAIQFCRAGPRRTDDERALRRELAAREAGETGPVRSHGVRRAGEATGRGDGGEGDGVATAHVVALVKAATAPVAPTLTDGSGLVVANSNPAGRVIVIVPIPISPAVVTTIDGPASEAYVPLPGGVPAVSAETAPPP